MKQKRIQQKIVIREKRTNNKEFESETERKDE